VKAKSQIAREICQALQQISKAAELTYLGTKNLAICFSELARHFDKEETVCLAGAVETSHE
jgi:hypothetical protein